MARKLTEPFFRPWRTLDDVRQPEIDKRVILNSPLTKSALV
jgi:hypothetical protein